MNLPHQNPNPCILPAKVRERENFGPWSAWSGGYLFETCVEGNIETGYRTRWQDASVDHPYSCLYETQVCRLHSTYETPLDQPTDSVSNRERGS